MTEEELKTLENLDVEEARQRVEAQGFQFRVISQDGESFAATTDYRTDRVNVHIAEGKVVSAGIG